MPKLELWYPVYPFHVNQHFGENIPCVKNFGLPNQVVLSGADNTTCPIGFDKLYAHFGMKGHNGCDLQAGEQTCWSSTKGTVIEKQIVAARGLGLGIITDTPVDMGHYGVHYAKIRYWHLKSFNVEVGDHVDVGTVLGITDTTGFSAGNHLHFEVQPMDKDAGGHFYLPTGVPDTIAFAIDPETFFNGFYAKDQAKVISVYQQLIAVLMEILKKQQAPTVGQ